MEWKNIKLEHEDGLWILTVNRPEVRNALDPATAKEIGAALDSLDTTKPGVLIITGAGEKAFVAGADIGDLRNRNKIHALDAVTGPLFTRIENFPWPVIAAVNGYALGGGCELALVCDIRVASESARFGLPEANLGIIPGAGGTQRLPRLIGLSRAKDWVLTGDMHDAHDAERVGLVSRVVAPAELMPAAKEIARKILARAPLALRLAKLTMNASSSMSLDTGLAMEMLAESVLYESKDKFEGTSAFLEKRKPKFVGE